jgi:peptidoglycan/LPS O-acetylase OafA/YrhL
MRMEDKTLLFALIGGACYLVAFLTSHAFVLWVLPEKLRAGLGSGGRNVPIDGIRGYLAFGVYVHHCLLTWIYLREGHLVLPPHNFEFQLGATSVAVFFMITAFLFWGRAQAKAGLEVKGFFISRLFRIYPLYLFALVLISAGVAYKSNWTLLEPATRIAFEMGKWLGFRTPDINNYPAIQIDAVTWTLLYEAWFYLSLPLLVVVFLKKFALWKSVVALAIIALLFKLNHLQIGIAAAFLGGVIAVYWVRDKKRIAFAQTHGATVVALLSLACVVLFMYRPFNPVGIALLSIFFTVIASGNSLFGFLKMRSGLWLGEISYSIYLLHAIVLWVLMENVLPRLTAFHLTTKWFAISAIGITPILVLFSSATYLLIEKPLINLGHRLSKRRVDLVTAKLEAVPVAGAVQPEMSVSP